MYTPQHQQIDLLILEFTGYYLFVQVRQILPRRAAISLVLPGWLGEPHGCIPCTYFEFILLLLRPPPVQFPTNHLALSLTLFLSSFCVSLTRQICEFTCTLLVSIRRVILDILPRFTVLILIRVLPSRWRRGIWLWEGRADHSCHTPLNGRESKPGRAMCNHHDPHVFFTLFLIFPIFSCWPSPPACLRAFVPTLCTQATVVM